MKIFIPFKVKDIGGTSSFARKFAEGLTKLGHEVFFDFKEDYDVLFLIVQCPFRCLIHAKKNKRRIIQRLDGVYFWSIAGWKFPLYNLKAAIIRWFYADQIVYQSEYSKYCVNKFLGKKPSEESHIIFNGVNLNLFSNKGSIIDLRDNPEQRIFFSASEFRRKDQLFPIIEALDHYKKNYNENFKLVIAGSFSRELMDFPEKFAHLKNIQFLGKINNGDLPKYERAADVFLFTHLNPPCPNNIIEAMACGLPICGISDGSMPEIVENGKTGLLSYSRGDAFWFKRKINTLEFSENINKIIRNRKEYSINCRKTAESKFSLEKMIQKYSKILCKE